MDRRMTWTALALTVLAALTGAACWAQGGGARQRYGGWMLNPDKGYYYRKYEYKVRPTDTRYQHQYVIYYKNDQRIPNTWVYFYNPTTQKFWARYPTVRHQKFGAGARAGKELWSILPAAARHKNLHTVDLKRFSEPNPAVCPPIPGSTDNTPMRAPTSDLP